MCMPQLSAVHTASFSKLLFVPLLVLLTAPAEAATFTVSSAADEGPDTLRQAILDVNAQVSGDHTISIDARLTITPATELPDIVYAGGRTIIEGNGATLDGSGLSRSESGLTFQQTATLRGLTVINFPSHGVVVRGDDCAITSCRIGTDGATTDDGNGGDGIRVQDVSNFTLGNSRSGGENWIGGNGGDGVFVLQCAGFTMYNNFIGINSDLDTAIPNGNNGANIVLSSDGTVGGAAAYQRNCFAGNGTQGFYTDLADDFTIVGNYCGVAPDGTTVIGNGGPGIYLNRSTNCTVGGTDEGEGNLVSGNNTGIAIYDESSTGNTVLGNLVGTDHTGTVAIPNTTAGLLISSGANNTIGGAVPGAGNVISGNNGPGISLQNAACTGNEILGNYIGVDATGAAALPNSGHGVFLAGSPSVNAIGGDVDGEGNVIAGNTGCGIYVNTDSNENSIEGNYIGVNAAGDAAIPNSGEGVLIRGHDNTIGGVTAGAGNVISGNSGSGIRLEDGAATYATTIQRNYIGVNAAGDAAIPNGFAGIFVDEAYDTTIGGESSAARNVISGNGNSGIVFSGSTGNLVQRNYIGTDATGQVAIPNTYHGIVLEDTSTTAIGGANTGNVISGNPHHGIHLFAASTTSEDVTIQGNYIGVDATGDAAMPNGERGIYIEDMLGVVVGGPLPGEGNVISANGASGIYAAEDMLACEDLTIQGNHIGVSASGAKNGNFGNSGDGITLTDGVSVGLIGGTTEGAANIIANNAGAGIRITGADANLHTMRQNSIYANTGDGIVLEENANSPIFAPFIGSITTGDDPVVTDRKSTRLNSSHYS